MSRKLRPEKDTLFIPVFLVFQVVRLMGIAECIETGCLYLFYTGCNLFIRKSMRLAKLVLILASSVDENRLIVQEKPPIGTGTFNRSTHRSDTVGCCYFIICFIPPFDHGG